MTPPFGFGREQKEHKVISGPSPSFSQSPHQQCEPQIKEERSHWCKAMSWWFYHTQLPVWLLL
jgi:hypothetical protein